VGMNERSPTDDIVKRRQRPGRKGERLEGMMIDDYSVVSRDDDVLNSAGRAADRPTWSGYSDKPRHGHCSLVWSSTLVASTLH